MKPVLFFALMVISSVGVELDSLWEDLNREDRIHEYTQEDYNKYVEAVDKAFASDPTDPAVAMHKSRLYESKFKFKDAEAVIRKSLEFYQDNEGLLWTMGNLLHMQGKPKEAFEYWNRISDSSIVLNNDVKLDEYMNLAATLERWSDAAWAANELYRHRPTGAFDEIRKFYADKAASRPVTSTLDQRIEQRRIEDLKTGLPNKEELKREREEALRDYRAQVAATERAREQETRERASRRNFLILIAAIIAGALAFAIWMIRRR